MSDVIFTRTRHEYDSYTDYWKLVELSGFETCYVDEIDPDSHNTYIVAPLNGEWNQGWENPVAQIIWWDLEWRLDQPFEGILPPGVRRVWASDRWYAEQIGAEYVPLGSHPGLSDDCRAEIDGAEYHCALMMYRDPFRRAHTIHRMEAGGLKIAPNGWGQARHEALLNSKMMVHIHQFDEVYTIAPLRFAIAAAWGLPVITERCSDLGVLKGLVLQADYDGMTSFVYGMSRQTDLLKQSGQRLHDWLCEKHNFQFFVEAVL